LRSDARLDGRHQRVIVTGFLINILKSELSIFFLAFLPQSSRRTRATLWCECWN